MLPEDESSKLLSLLPHRGSMRLIDSVEKIESSSAICITNLDTSKHQLFGFLDNTISTHIGIELIAQTAAIALIGSAKDKCQIQGQLIQVKHFEAVQTKIQSTGVLVIDVHVERPENGQLVLTNGSVSHKGVPICQAALTLFIE